MDESGSERRVLLVADATRADSLGAELDRAGSFDVTTESEAHAARDRLAWPDVDAVVVVDSPALDASSFRATVAQSYPTLPVYVLADGNEVDAELAARIEGRLDGRDAERTTDRFDDGGAERYPNVEEDDVDRLLAGDVDREEARDLLHRQQLVEALFGSIPTHLYVKDRQGRHRYVSERYFSEDPGEFLDRADPEIADVANDHAWRAFEDDRYVVSEGEPILDKEEYLPSLDKWNTTSKVPWRDADGDIVGVLGVTHDVTERKERRQELQRQNGRLEQFAEIVSHDLRNPLQVAQSSVALSMDDDDTEHLEAASRALDRMGTIIEDVLGLAKYGQSVIDPDPVAVTDVARRAWQTAGDPDSELSVADSLRPIAGEEGHVQQLLENLFANSVDHGVTSGRPDDNRDGDAAGVTVSVGPIVEDGRQVGFYVADDGRGIPESDRASVFEAGYSTADDGTGFGLSIVEQVAKSHGWSVAVTDSESGGARFEVRGVERADRQVEAD
jgi:signal transduction histidine kinase